MQSLETDAADDQDEPAVPTVENKSTSSVSLKHAKQEERRC